MSNDSQLSNKSKKLSEGKSRLEEIDDYYA